MTLHPEIQKKAQTELDEVVGANRFPDFDDYDSLPYIQAILLESARWLPVAPLGLPHRLTTDDYYNGYFIPKGTVVLPVCYLFSSATLTMVSQSMCAVF